MKKYFIKYISKDLGYCITTNLRYKEQIAYCFILIGEEITELILN